MNVIHTAQELNAVGRKVCLAIGFFDGVHLGHQQIIRQTIADARQQNAISLVLTFDRHPATVVAPSRAPGLIYPLAQKIRTIASMEAESLLLLHFDKALSERPGEEFIRSLVKELGQVHSLCVGANFTFGHKRAGNVALLKKLGEELRFKVHGMSSVALDGRTISSTRVREAIRTGDLDAAGQLLGRAYSIASQVMKGDRLGHTLGFPTANLDVNGLVLPPNGVYAAQAMVAGRTHRAVLNIGVRPTVQNPTPTTRLEVHLLDFNRDLYGQEIEVIFSDKLRDEQKFASLDELKTQIARDIETARNA